MAVASRVFAATSSMRRVSSEGGAWEGVERMVWDVSDELRLGIVAAALVVGVMEPESSLELYSASVAFLAEPNF